MSDQPTSTEGTLDGKISVPEGMTPSEFATFLADAINNDVQDMLKAYGVDNLSVDDPEYAQLKAIIDGALGSGPGDRSQILKGAAEAARQKSERISKPMTRAQIWAGAYGKASEKAQSAPVAPSTPSAPGAGKVSAHQMWSQGYAAKSPGKP